MSKKGNVEEVHERKEGQENGTSKTGATIEALARLLESSPAAEELTRTWQRSKGETWQSSGPRLQDLRRAVDAGKLLQRGEGKGIPMWIIVRMCKASWHQDGTWPLLGADEQVSSNEIASLPITRSIHPSSELLRPRGVTCFQIPEDGGDRPQTQQQPEPSAEDIAAAYRRRGIAVEEAKLLAEEED